jgi:hypothetical protein
VVPWELVAQEEEGDESSKTRKGIWKLLERERGK